MVLQRNEINEKDTWDLSTIFETDQKWEEELALLTKDTKQAASLEGHLLDSAESLLNITEHYLDLSRRLEKLYVYAHMKNDQDTRVAKYQEYYAKAMTLYSQLDQVFSFYEPEFMAITESVIAIKSFCQKNQNFSLINTSLINFCKIRTMSFHNVKKSY